MGLTDRLKRSVDSILGSGGDVSDSVVAVNEDGVVSLNGEKFILTREVAMKLSALNEGVNLISDTVASLPVYLYRREDDGSRTKVDDYRNGLLNRENSPHSTAYNMKKNLIMDFLLEGNGYIDIHRDSSNKIISLMHVPHGEMSLVTISDANKRLTEYQYQYWTMTNQFHEVLNLVRNPQRSEVKGIGVLAEGSAVIEGAAALDDYTASINSNGFNARGVIESEKIMTKPSRDSLSDMLKKFFSGGKKAGKVLILDDGMKYKSLNLSPADLNLLQQKSFTVEDIARLLKMPGYLLGASGSSMVYSNVEQTQLMFLQMTIDPLLRLVESTLNKYLLSEAEKENGYFFEFNTQNMLRTTPEKEIAMYSAAVKGTLLTVNEARKKMNWNRLEGMDRPIVMSGTCIVSDTGEIIGTSSTSVATDTVKGGDDNDNTT